MDDQSQKPINPQMQNQNISGAPSMGKEVEPIATGEPVTLSEQQPRLPQDVERAGVRIVNNEHPLPRELGELGADLAKEAKAPNLAPTLNVPMTKVQAQTAAKGNISNSVTWLAALITLVFKKNDLKGEV